MKSKEIFEHIREEAEALEKETGNGYLVYSRHMSDILLQASQAPVWKLAQLLELGKLVAEAYTAEMIRRANNSN